MRKTVQTRARRAPHRCRVDQRLIRNADTSFTIKENQTETSTNFSSAGNLTSIADRDGNKACGYAALPPAREA